MDSVSVVWKCQYFKTQVVRVIEDVAYMKRFVYSVASVVSELGQTKFICCCLCQKLGTNK